MGFIGLSKPKEIAIEAPLKINDKAPDSKEFNSTKSIQLIGFLRHVGCPFAENMVKQLRDYAEIHTDTEVFIVSHGSKVDTLKWLDVIGGIGKLTLVIDTDRSLYARWGLGFTSFVHFAGLSSIAGVLKLLSVGIRNRDASGTRWQSAGLFLIADRKVRWLHIPNSAEQFKLPL